MSGEHSSSTLSAFQAWPQNSVNQRSTIPLLSWVGDRGVLIIGVVARTGPLLKIPNAPAHSVVREKARRVDAAMWAGQRYRVQVADAAPWDYDVLSLPFSLTTSLE
jgi:hypothetical protein